MIAKGLAQFKQEPKVDPENMQVLFEITLNNLSAEGDIDEQDFLDRADVLCGIGQTVLISNYQKYYKLVEFFSATPKRMGVIMGASTSWRFSTSATTARPEWRHLGSLWHPVFARSQNLALSLKDEESEELWTSTSTPIHPRHKPLFDYLTFNKRITDIHDFDPEVLSIFSRSAESIKNGGEDWVAMVLDFVDRIIKENCLFGFCVAQPEEGKAKEDPAEAAARAIEQK